MKSKTHDKLKKTQLFVAISLLLLSTLLLFKTPGITGHFSADFMSQQLNMVIEQSQSFEIATNNQESIYVSSLRLSGNVIGQGSVEVFIENDGQKYKIFQNIRERETGLTAITGMAVAKVDKEEEAILLSLTPSEVIEWDKGLSLSDTEEYTEGVFNNKCLDTCFMEMSLSSEERYKLIFMVEPGTEVQITKITYTLKDDHI